MDLIEDILSLGRLGNIQGAGHKNTAGHSRKENPEETEKRDAQKQKQEVVLKKSDGG